MIVAKLVTPLRHMLQYPLAVVLASADGGGSGGGDTGYLAQHPLLEQIPELRADVEQPEYCALGEGRVRSVNAWFGPAGTVRCPLSGCNVARSIRCCACPGALSAHAWAWHATH